MTDTHQLAARSSLRAFRAGQYVLIVAEGELPTPGFDVDIVPSMLMIFPPQFNLVQCPKAGLFTQVVTPYRYAESVRFPEDQPTVTVHHADGSDTVTIEGAGPELAGYLQTVNGSPDRPCPEGADEAIGFSKNLSFDEAFANAVANLAPVEPPVPDALSRVQVVEIGGLFGGIAGFRDLFVRICRTHDG